VSLAKKVIVVGRREGLRGVARRAVWKLRQFLYQAAVFRAWRKKKRDVGTGRASDGGDKGTGPPFLKGRAGASRAVNILTPTFFDLRGQQMLCGGAERYLLELADIIELRFGYGVNVYQAGVGNWVRSYGRVLVHSLDTGEAIDALNHVFHSRVSPAALTIYFSFYYAFPLCHDRSLGVSHGVFWDHPAFQGPDGSLSGPVKNVLGAIRNLSKVVSVDTNTINWVRAVSADLSSRFVHVPNFVDTVLFRPGDSRTTAPDRLVVLYPRRLYPPRGFWLVLEILPYLLRRYGNLEFHFVGQADEAEERAVRETLEAYPGRVRQYWVSPEEMPEVYRAADITLIPTTYAEGTSLSCLEAMASGNAVVATNVGGLPELIQDRFSGLLVEPSADALREAVETLILDSELRRSLQRNARQVARAFDVRVWRRRWEAVLETYLERREPVPAQVSVGGASPPPAKLRTRVLIYPRTPGITWRRMRQRPHHLCQSLAAMGIPTYFASADGAKERHLSAGHLHIIASEDEIHVDHPIVYFHYPYNYEVLTKFRHPFVVYDVLDSVAIHLESDHLNSTRVDRTARTYHLRALKRADLILAASQPLVDECRRMGRDDVILVRNGVDVEHFAAAARARQGGPSRPNGARPVVGFHGCIAPWLDFALLEELIRMRPDLEFVFVGPVHYYCQDSFRRLMRCRNVVHRGERPYEELPQHLATFDVGLIPFVLNDVTRAASPIKLYEYAAAGIPTVATPLPECSTHECVLLSEPDPKQFSDEIDRALSLRGEPAYQALLTVTARSNSWEQRAAVILAALRAKCLDAPLAGDEERLLQRPQS